LRLESLEDRALPASMVAVGTDAGIISQVRVFVDRDDNGTYDTLAPGAVTNPVNFTPYGSFTGGARVVFGDFDGDFNDELVTGAGPNGGPHVIVWDMNPDGTVAGIRDSFFAFGATFAGGVFVAAGDIDGDLRDELVVSADAGGGPHVKIFSDTDRDGQLSDNMVDQFFPFPGFTGGVRIAVGATNNATGEELVVAAGPGGGPHIKVYTDSDDDRAVSDNPLVEEYLAYHPSFSGGVYVTAGFGEYLATGAGQGGSPHVRIFRDVNNDGRVSDDAIFDEFLAYGAGFTGGVRVHADTNNFGLVTGAGPGGGSHVKVYADNADTGALLSDNALFDQFIASPDLAGVFVAVGDFQDAHYAAEGFNIPIPDASTLTRSLWIPAGAGVVRDVAVNLSITHEFLNDIEVVLRHVPSNRSVTLFTDVGGTDPGGFMIRLNDLAFTDIGAVTTPANGFIVGEFNPEGAAVLSTFDGVDATGEWQLLVTDDANADFGNLISWSLDISY
jgi:hypothetical protein